MGSSTSTNQRGLGNISTGSIHGNIGGNLGGINLEKARFTRSSPHAARSLSTVMNCGENPLRIYLHEQELDAGSFTDEQGSTTYFKQDNETPFIVIPAKGSESFGGRPAFASVFVQYSTDPEVIKATIYVSSAVPPGRSFIVTNNHEIKLQKEGSDNKWQDEDGVDKTEVPTGENSRCL